MKNSKKGFIVPVLLVIIALLVIGGGVYVYKNKKVEVPAVVDTGTQQTNTQTSPVVNTQTNNPPAQTDTSFKVLSPKAGDSWKIGSVYSVKFQNLPKGSFVQGWLQDKNGANTGTASIGVIDTGRDGNPSSNIQITVPSQWCGGECGAVEYVASGQYRLLLRVYPSVNNSSYQTFYSDYFTITSAVATNEQKVLATAREVIGSLSARDYQKLEGLVSSNGLSLNFYPQLDLVKNLIAKNDVSEIPNDTKIYLWGYTDGKGDPINLTRAQFLTTYIYSNSVDYLKAPDVAVNKTLGSGNSLNTIAKDVNGRTYVAFHFSGFDPKYGGMDWTTLYLVFDSVNGEYKLRGITKDNWTI
jgi:hypothetical protein